MNRHFVISLDEALKVTRGNTLRSSLYQEKAGRLTVFQRRRLSILEEKLFNSRRGLSFCEARDILKDEACFESEDGALCYFFSSHKRKFILLDFSLNGGGAGGSFVPPDGKDDLGATRCSIRSAANARRLTAHSERYCVALANAVSRVLRFASLFSMKLDQVFELADRKLYPRIFSRFIDQRCERIFSKELSDGAWASVPEWSILAPFVEAPEQLHNRYARSVITGEQICRIMVSTPYGRSLLSSYARYRSLHVDLLHEVNHVLDIIFIGREVPSATLKTLEVTRALQNELLADDRVFSLAKSELTAHLSAFIARSVAVSSVGSRGGHYRLSHGSAIGVMRKYALLAEFVAISARLSGFDRNTLDVDAIYNDYCDELRGRQRAKALRNIVDFDCSLSLLMEGLHLQLDIDREEHVDSADLHRRLICVTRELLDPLVIE